MVATVTTAWADALTATGVEPVWVVEVLGPGLTAFWASRSWGPGGPWRSDDGAIANSSLRSDSQHGPYATPIALLSGGGIGDISQQLDDESGVTRVANVTVQMLNADLKSTRLFRRIENAAVRIRLGALGPLGHADFLPLFYGFADQPHATLERLGLTLLHGAFKWHRTLTAFVDPHTFPGAPATSRGQVIPILVGRNIDVEGIAIAGEAVGHLAFDVSSGATTCDLVEYAAPFPSSGEITLGTETGVTYTERLVLEISGVSYLRLLNLVRGAPVTQSAGATVTRTSVTYDYLLGYDVSELLNVRDDGALLSSANYTFVPVFNAGAERPVAMVQLDAAPSGLVTFDCEGGNLQALDTFVNGSFETGDITGWSTSGGASTVVNTTDPDEGTYKLELTGDFGSSEEISQEIATAPGRFYTLLFSHRDQDDALAGNLLSGGLLDDAADLALWTEEENTDDTPYTIVTIPQTGQTFLAISGGIFNNQDGQLVQSYQLILSSTATTVVSTGYTVSVRYAALITLIFGIGAGGVVSANPALGSAVITLECGTAADPDFYFSTDLFAEQAWQLYDNTFTASGTTTQIRLIMRGLGIDNAPAPQTRLDFVTLTPTSTAGRSISSYRLGIPGDEARYGSGTLAYESSIWLRQSVDFFPTSATTRVGLLSQYNNSAVVVASEYDHVRLAVAGRNPVDVIRYIIEEFVPALAIHEASFQAAYTARVGWSFGGEFRPPGNSRELLDRLADQCACRRVENGAGECVLVPFDIEASPIYGFNTSTIVVGSVEVAPEPADNVYTHLYVYYNHRTGTDRNNVGNYGAVVYATPDGTSSDEGLDVLCQAARTSTGRDRIRRYPADAIQDQQTAHLLLTTLVQQHAVRTYDVTFQARLDAARLELGDIVLIDHPLVPNTPVLAEVQAVRVRPGAASVRLTARITRSAGSEDQWEPPAETQGAGSEDQWES